MCTKEIEDKIDQIMSQTVYNSGFKDGSIRTTHMKIFLSIVLEGMSEKDWSKLKSIASFKLGVSERKISEYMKGLVACDIFIIDDNGNITYNEVK